MSDETYEPPITQTDEQEKLIEELHLSLNATMVRVTRLEGLMAQLATAAVASTAAFDTLREFLRDQMGLGGAVLYDQDADEEFFDGRTPKHLG